MFIRNLTILLMSTLTMMSVNALAAGLKDIKFSELPGERAELRLLFEGGVVEPQGYTIDQPARIVLDFAGVENLLAEKKYAMSVGEVSSAVVVAGGGRTRLIVNLNNLVPFTSRIDGQHLVVEIGSESASAPAVVTSSITDSVAPSREDYASSNSVINNIDFRRGDIGEGKVIVSLSNPNIAIDVEESSSGVSVSFMDTALPDQMRRKLDVVDFATPVKMLGSSMQGSNTVIEIDASGDFDYLAYQADNEYVISIKPLSQQEIEDKKRAFAYVGDVLSLNFQDIQVRSVLQLIADFTELNLVASDTVTGSITLRLENVPWDQALDLVLKTKGLDKRQIGNVLMVAPAAEIAEREKQEIETKKQLEELAPLRTEYIRIRYANARELFSLFMSEGGGGQSGAGDSGGGGGNARNSTGSMLSDRGQAIVDERTNSIILTDTEEKISKFKLLVDRIDIPVKQVMIEARLVIANSDFRKELGFRMSGDAVDTSESGSHKHEFTGSLEGLGTSGGGGPEDMFTNPVNNATDRLRDLEASNLVDLGVFNPTGSITWNVISSNFLLGMELSALQDSGFAEIVSQPKVITGDKQPASIQSGTEVPYQAESASGGTTTSFKEVLLRLEVTPQITPDNRVIMDLIIDQDSVTGVSAGVPIIDVTHLETSVLVSDGDTVVLGGIYQTETVKGEEKVPLLGDVPFLGVFFRHNISSEEKRELLIFVTPRIMNSDFLD
ncbi:type IV pilus secretin PilQ [Teredinibacter franksiae]|uniref:type IV pilus secretin PilQ n=1 Tax=Teredinibacter franksiae TaxID=2761453 RepID=UPI0016278786|nr:type IV pilus secretin PilQ [Teredinibacter franksiae]